MSSNPNKDKNEGNVNKSKRGSQNEKRGGSLRNSGSGRGKPSVQSLQFTTKAQSPVPATKEATPPSNSEVVSPSPQPQPQLQPQLSSAEQPKKVTQPNAWAQPLNNNKDKKEKDAVANGAPKTNGTSTIVQQTQQQPQPQSQPQVQPPPQQAQSKSPAPTPSPAQSPQTQTLVQPQSQQTQVQAPAPTQAQTQTQTQVHSPASTQSSPQQSAAQSTKENPQTHHPQAQHGASNFTFNAPIPRTHSAPPTLEEQAKILPPPAFIPEKGIPYKYYSFFPNPMGPGFPAQFGTAPFIPTAPVPFAPGSGPAFTSQPPARSSGPVGMHPGSVFQPGVGVQPIITPPLGVPATPARKGIPIIDPATGKEVAPNSPPKQRSSSSSSSSAPQYLYGPQAYQQNYGYPFIQHSSKLPGGMLPELYNQTQTQTTPSQRPPSKAITITDPNDVPPQKSTKPPAESITTPTTAIVPPAITPPTSTLSSASVSPTSSTSTSPTPLSEAQDSKGSSTSKPKTPESPKSQKSSFKGKPDVKRQEYRAKSPSLVKPEDRADGVTSPEIAGATIEDKEKKEDRERELREKLLREKEQREQKEKEDKEREEKERKEKEDKEREEKEKQENERREQEEREKREKVEKERIEREEKEKREREERIQIEKEKEQERLEKEREEKEEKDRKEKEEKEKLQREEQEKQEQPVVQENEGEIKPIELPKKLKKKDILKKAEEGSYRALSFDAYTIPSSEADKEKAKEKKEAEKDKAEKTEISQPHISEESDEDDWESKDEEAFKLRKTPDILAPQNIQRPSQQAQFSAAVRKAVQYFPGSWSPENQSGKKMYDRSFLLQFADMFKDRPEELPNIDDIMLPPEEAGQASAPVKDTTKPPDQQWKSGQGVPMAGRTREPRSQMRPGEIRPPPGFSQYARGGSVRGMPPGMTGMTRGRGGKRMSMKGPSQMLPEVAPLQHSENRWETSREKQVTDEEKFYKKVKSILNKLTVENFESMTNKLTNLPIESVEVLKNIIKFIFEKALLEPKFSKMYAEVCSRVHEKSPNFEVEGKPQTFKRLLLNRCQEEFEASFKGAHKPRPTKSVEEMTREEKIQLEEEEFLAKKKMLGNITFIGELFKARMLTERVMNECITRLLGDIKNPSHDDIEALCKLLTTIGPDIDHEKAKSYMNQYFARMRELSKNQSLPPRIKFMLEDTIALRESGWISRMPQQPMSAGASTTTPTAKVSGKELQDVRSTMSRSRENTPVGRTGLGRGSMQAPPMSAAYSRNVSAPNLLRRDEWETVGKGGKSAAPPARVYRTPSQDELPLRPQTTLGPANSMSQGAKGWSQSQPQPQPPARSQSEFKLQEKKPERSEARRPSIDNGKPSELLQSPRDIMSQEELERNVDELLEELLSSSDIGEAVTCVKELRVPQYNSDIILKAISVGLEKNEKDRDLISRLLAALNKEGILTADNFIKGFHQAFDIMEELVIDIPQAPTLLANFIAYGILDGFLTLSMIEPDIQRMIDSKIKNLQAAELLVEIFSTIASSTAGAKMREIFEKSHIDLATYMPSQKRNMDNVIKLLESRKLRNLMPLIIYGKQLESMIKEDTPVDEILTWAEDNMDGDALSDTNLCRHIVRCILSHVTSKADSLSPNPSEDSLVKEKQYVGKYSYLLTAVIQHNQSLQINALNEVQLFYKATKFPKGLLERLFQYFYEFQIISPRGYKGWTEDTSVSEGKQEALDAASKWISSLPQTPIQDTTESYGSVDGDFESEGIRESEGSRGDEEDEDQ